MTIIALVLCVLLFGVTGPIPVSGMSSGEKKREFTMLDASMSDVSGLTDATVSAAAGMQEAATQDRVSATASVRRMLAKQPDFLAEVVMEKNDEERELPAPSRIAKRGESYRFELGGPGQYGPQVILFRQSRSTVLLIPSERKYREGGGLDSQALAATWMLAEELLKNPKWMLEEVGSAVMDGHPCARVRATYVGRSSDPAIDLYIALDLRNLIISVQAPPPPVGARCGRVIPQSYRLTNIGLGVPASLFRIPPGYKPLEIYDPPPPCLGVTPDRQEIESGEQIHLRAEALDPGDNTFEYTWSSSGGRIEGSCSEAMLDTSGLAPGDYTVTLQLNDGYSHVVECSTSIHVKAHKPEFVGH